MPRTRKQPTRSQSSSTARVARAFTLVELIVVIIILAILSGVAVPVYLDHSTRAKSARAESNRATLVSAINDYRHQQLLAGSTHTWPPTLDGLLDDQEFLNPFAKDRRANPFQEVSQNAPNAWHPSTKDIESANRSIWYNPTNGALRFRVPRQPTSQDFLDLYNHVNQSSVTTENQTTP